MGYEIGYRRPPESGRFKQGKSGNPKGRPKGSTNFLTILERELGQSIVVNENGKKKTITRMQAMVKRIVAGALQGDLKALMTLFDNYQSVLDSYVTQRQKAGGTKLTKTSEA